MRDRSRRPASVRRGEPVESPAEVLDLRTLAILPVKRFKGAKQRLAPQLGGGARQALAQAMFSDVLASLCRARELDAIAVVTGDHAAESIARGKGVEVLYDGGDQGQSPAARIGVRYALNRGYDRVLLVPGDAPLLDAVELDGLLTRSEAAGRAVTIVPDRHGEGTNALLLAPPDAIQPSFGEGSFWRHVGAVRGARLEHSVEPLASLEHDIDTPDDLAEVWSLIDRSRGVAPMTRGALRQLNRSRATSPLGTGDEHPAGEHPAGQQPAGHTA